MIPFERPALPGKLAAILTTRTTEITTSGDRYRTARATWKSAGPTRRELKKHLTVMCFRPAFCMYCQESRGTDVDHFVPIKREPHLTFQWRNHILACGFCNQQAKGEVFPVDTHGHPLLLDPGVDDSADHMTLSMTGHFIDLTARGAETIRVLGLNSRSELVQARHRSWRGIVRVFRQAARHGSVLDVEDLEDLRFLPIVDLLHHFAHAVAAPRRSLMVPDDIAAFATNNLGTLNRVFPTCDLSPPAR